ncbi:Carbohydrate esterase 4 protein [Tulasnella sp. 417]|nr:Carbohydrate esterase 4 protein [Tulasnella sp. 417]
MFTASRILAFSLLAAVASALPAANTERSPELGDISEAEAISLVERATLAPVYSKCTLNNTVAITFDDGPYTWTTDIVNTLRTYSANATFFVNGNNFQCIYSTDNEKRLKAAYNAGHQIASHTWTHADWTTLTKDQLKNEMNKTDTALKKILGVKPAFVRPPFGAYNDASREVAASNGQAIVIWDFDSGDTAAGATVEKSKAAYKAIADKKPMSILTLNHETHETTVKQVLPYALNYLKAKGYKFVTVAECLGHRAPYSMKTTPGTRDSTWKC